MSEPWVATHNLTSTPGSGFHYSSTNFGILGLVLGHHHASTRGSGGGAMKGYRDFNQSSFLPPALASAAASVQWATSGSPRDHGVVPGFDRTDYNGQVRRVG